MAARGCWLSPEGKSRRKFLLWGHPLVVGNTIYMRNFAYMCIIIWIHMDAHELYVLFKIWIFYLFLFDQSFGPIEDVVTIFHQVNKGKYVVFIAMIHLMRYFFLIWFCIILLDLMTQDKYHILISKSDISFDILYIDFIFIFATHAESAKAK